MNRCFLFYWSILTSVNVHNLKCFFIYKRTCPIHKTIWKFRCSKLFNSDNFAQNSCQLKIIIFLNEFRKMQKIKVARNNMVKYFFKFVTTRKRKKDHNKGSNRLRSPSAKYRINPGNSELI